MQYKYDKLGNRVNGLTMNHKQLLNDYAENLVSQYATYQHDNYELCLSKLQEDDQNELLRLYIEANNRETNECIYGDDFSINNDFNCALLAMLQNDCKETRERLAEVTRKNTFIYYKQSLQELIDEACVNFIHNVNNENGYFMHRDMEHGDMHWSKW